MQDWPVLRNFAIIVSRTATSKSQSSNTSTGASPPNSRLRGLILSAAFAIQQATPQYSQLTAIYSPNSGYFPLAPWAGFAVLCGYAALALGLAVVLLRRRDA